MINLEIRERFLKEEPKMRLGHLASDLARVASFIEMNTDGKTIKSVIEEGKFFAEWTVREVKLVDQMLLADIQGFLAQKEREWDFSSTQDFWRQNIVNQAREWSTKLLESAGFVDHE